MDLGKYPTSALAFAAGEPFVLCSLNDPRLTPEEVELYRSSHHESSLSVPIVVGGEMVGLIEVHDDAEREWGDGVDFLINVCQHVAGIFANSVLLDEVQRRAAFGRELVALAESLSRAADARELALTAADTLRRVLDAEDCDIWNLDQGRLRCLVSIDRTGVDTAVEGKTARPRALPVHGRGAREP